jgi:hypothetical protein
MYLPDTVTSSENSCELLPKDVPFYFLPPPDPGELFLYEATFERPSLMLKAEPKLPDPKALVSKHVNKLSDSFPQDHTTMDAYLETDHCLTPNCHAPDVDDPTDTLSSTMFALSTGPNNRKAIGPLLGTRKILETALAELASPFILVPSVLTY